MFEMPAVVKVEELSSKTVTKVGPFSIIEVTERVTSCVPWYNEMFEHDRTRKTARFHPSDAFKSIINGGSK